VKPVPVIRSEDDESLMIPAGGEFHEESTAQGIVVLGAAFAGAASGGLVLREVNTERGTEFFVSV